MQMSNSPWRRFQVCRIRRFDRNYCFERFVKNGYKTAVESEPKRRVW